MTGITGPSVRPKLMAAETIALVIHELATNAMKYGALSIDHGQMTAEWTIERLDAERHLVFRWVETGVRLSGGPHRRDLDIELIERTLAYELDSRRSRNSGSFLGCP